MCIETLCSTSTGRKCDGYEDLSKLKDSKKSKEKSRTPPTTSASVAPVSKLEHRIVPSMNSTPLLAHQQAFANVPPARPDAPGLEATVKPPLDSREARATHYFSTFTIPALGGTVFADFWERTVLQASYAKPVRHGVLALGALHEDIVTASLDPASRSNPELREFASQHYTQGIAALHSLMASWPPCFELTLISCILFVCYNCLAQQHETAIIHLSAGLNIFKDVHGQRGMAGSAASAWESTFAPTLLALSVRLATITTPPENTRLAILRTALHETGMATFSSTFRSLREARYSLDTLIAESLVDSVPLDPRLGGRVGLGGSSAQNPRHSAALTAWSLGMDEFLALYASSHPNRGSTWRQSTILRTHHAMLAHKTHASAATEQSFQAILSMCQGVMSASPDNLQRPISFTLDMGITEPLEFIAASAPSDQIRQQATNMLLGGSQGHTLGAFTLPSIHSMARSPSLSSDGVVSPPPLWKER